ncbi:MAG: phosphoesterase [Planctomycetota bacterium]
MACSCALLLGTARLSAADVVVDWNNVLLDTIRATGGPPCPISRTQALVHAAIYDAVNSIDRRHEPYLDFVSAPVGASADAAAAAAAHRVLTTLFPARAAVYDATLTASLAAVPNGANETAGVTLGRAVADALLSERADDGTQTDPPYVIGTNPGDWRTTFPDNTSPPFNCGWGNTVPWTLLAGDQFRPAGPLGFRKMSSLLSSRGYADQVNEVKVVGSRNSTVRTTEQTRIAFFWANDVNGTYKPPGHLNAITQVVSRDRRLSMIENARLFALINLAMGDAGIVAWDSKYNTNIDLWRPITAIRLAGTDGNSRTTADPNWEPLNPFSPPFPAYISGHATFGAAHAAVMAGYFGTDKVTFTITSEDPFYAGLPSHPARTFNKFSDAAWENAISRLYLGVHYRFDATDGNRAGTDVGKYVVRNYLRSISRADIDGNGAVALPDLTAFLNAYIAGQVAADIDGNGVLNTLDVGQFVRLLVPVGPR